MKSIENLGIQIGMKFVCLPRTMSIYFIWTVKRFLFNKSGAKLLNSTTFIKQQKGYGTS